ncbi:MAG TPA: ABC transporter substrate-binding protein [Stellaceae bacterium]|jgi:peptide/nickel transport system substrate-binding protein|nr:ABC transporter substrate-binding protein [Stellaceae bacterium]
MRGLTRILLAAAAVLPALFAGSSDAAAQKRGGILRVYHRDSPANMSIYEEGTISVVGPMMGVFNNLVVFDPNQKQNRLDDIVPDLADSWSWSSDNTALTVKLHPGVKWHDGKPFTASDVKCTWDLLQGKTQEKLRLNARGAWWHNLDQVTVDSDLQATFHLKRPQPSFMALLATGFSPVYPCHVTPAQMRQHPIGTGPFKFVEFKPNQSIKVTRNPDYWKPGLPYLDGVEWTIIPNRSTAILAFIAGKFDMTFPYEVTIPMLKDVHAQMPEAVCETAPLNVAPNLLITRKPPFDNVELRRAIADTIDHKTFIDILGEGQGDIGTAMLPAPEGVWAMPKEMMEKLPGYGPDLAKRRADAKAVMQKLGYGPEKPLELKISARNLAIYRDPASIIADQLKGIGINAELDLVETANWLPRLIRSDFIMALSLVGSGLDDPDQNFYENYVCDSNRNYTHYCNKDMEKLIDQQSAETDLAKRKQMVWQVDSILQNDVVRPILYHMRQATCWRPEVKGIKLMSNSIYNGWRMEDVWLDK